ncbi:MAG: hypothetical protein AB1772_13430 [Candidatus Zixiibacteriota bacterium]
MRDLLGFLVLTMPLPLIVAWIVFTWLLWKTGRRFLDASFANRPIRLVLIAVVGALWFGGSFWEAGGKKLYWDVRVRELCAKDGGVRVYETVELPAERFDRWGNARIPSKRSATPEDEYYFEIEDNYYRKGNPKLLQSRFRTIRRSDGKVLGETVYYSRIGGDLPGPWHESNFTCPNPSRLTELEPKVFVRGEN